MTQTMKFSTAAALAVMLSFAAIAPAFAYSDDLNVVNDNDVKVKVSNRAMVTSSTGASANTGNNVAGGSKGGNGGSANTNADEVENNFSASVGSTGGNGGNAGNGGEIYTGNATANAGSANIVNSNDVKVRSNCGCTEDTEVSGSFDDVTVNNDNDTKVRVRNSALVMSETDAGANTGYNYAKGSKGGRGGNADTDADDVDENFVANVGSTGGTGGNGGLGGFVSTGNAEANSGSVNMVNSTIVRVRR